MKYVKLTQVLIVMAMLSCKPLLAPNLDKYQLEQKQSNMRRIARLDELMSSDFSPENLRELLFLLDAPDPQVIYNQARLETANFTSNVFRRTNGCFCMHLPRVRPTTSNGYIIADNGSRVAKYDTWVDSVLDLLLYFEYYEGLGYDTSDYYSFLVEAGYCELGSTYVVILKSMA